MGEIFRRAKLFVGQNFRRAKLFVGRNFRHFSKNSSLSPDKLSPDKVRTRTTRGGVKEYLVKWKGWDNSFNSWVKDIRTL